MQSRWIIAGASFGASALLVGCGTESGAQQATATTLKLGTPVYVTVTLPPPVTSAPPEPGTIVRTEQSYTVESGDFLLGIAKLFCIDAQQIADYNGWVDGITRPLQPGNVVMIPPNSCPPGGTPSTVAETVPPTTVPVTTTTFNPALGGTYIVVDGDTLSGIAARIGTTVDAIVEANDWKDGARHVIYAGLPIELPPVG